jgi:putative ATP-binding cassette transporter
VRGASSRPIQDEPVPAQETSVSRLLATFAVVWRLAHPYFFSDDRRAGRILLAGVILIELSLVGINVMINRWQNAFYNALQNRDWDTFVTQLVVFSLLAGAFVMLAVYQLYLQQWLQIRWRAWMTRRYLDHWLADSNHYRMELLGEANLHRHSGAERLGHVRLLCHRPMGAFK